MALPVRETLATMREEVKNRLGFGGSGTAYTSNNNLIDSWLRETQEQLYTKHEFSELWIKDETAVSQEGQEGYDWPDAIDPMRIEKITVKDTSLTIGNVFPMREGIPDYADGYVSSADYDRPRRYRRASQLLVWPYPDGNNYTFQIRGYQRLGRFTQETDRATVDETLIKMLAVAKGKAHYRHPDAPNYDVYFRDMLKDLNSNDHGAERHFRPSGKGGSRGFVDSHNQPDMIHRNTLDL